jgi:hypothetical protein
MNVLSCSKSYIAIGNRPIRAVNDHEVLKIETQ